MKYNLKQTLILAACSLFFSMTWAQTDTIVEEEIYDVPAPEVYEELYDSTEMPMEIYEEPVSDWSYEEPKPRKYDFQTKFGFGFVSLSSSKAPVSVGSKGQYLPSTKFLSSNISHFELSFGKNIHKGLWRLWFGLGIEDEYHTFQDAGVRIQARSDSFAHYTVNATDLSPIGSDEQATSSSLEFTTVTVPLAIGYQNHQRRPKYKIQLGAYLGYRFQTATRVEYNDGTSLVIDGDFHANTFIIDPFVSVQYKRFGAFFRSSITPLIKGVGTANEQTRTAFGLFIGV